MFFFGKKKKEKKQEQAVPGENNYGNAQNR